MSKFNNLENDTLTYWLTTGTPVVTRPTAWYLGMASATPTEDGVTLNEPAYSGYARQAVTFVAPTTDGTTGMGVTSNSGAISFPAVAGSTQAVAGLVVYTASTSGTPLLYIPLNGGSRTLQIADVLAFDAGQITVYEE